MSNINTLRENYSDVVERRKDITNNMSITFEESYIYQNDILNVKEQKFDNISVCFQALRNKVNYIKNSINRETEFNNTAVSLDNLISKFDMFIDTLKGNSEKINLASRAAYNKYRSDFNDYFNSWENINDAIKKHFFNYNTCNQDLQEVNRKLEIAESIRNSGRDEAYIESLYEEKNQLEFNIEGTKNGIIGDIALLAKYNTEMSALLEVALKKSTLQHVLLEKVLRKVKPQ